VMEHAERRVDRLLSREEWVKLRIFEPRAYLVFRRIVLTTPENASPAGVELYLSVDDADEAYRTWKARGVEMVTEPWDAPFGRTFAFKDADGRVLRAYARP
jgi:hypothetical protein